MYYLSGHHQKARGHCPQQRTRSCPQSGGPPVPSWEPQWGATKGLGNLNLGEVLTRSNTEAVALGQSVVAVSDDPPSRDRCFRRGGCPPGVFSLRKKAADLSFQQVPPPNGGDIAVRSPGQEVACPQGATRPLGQSIGVLRRDQLVCCSM